MQIAWLLWLLVAAPAPPAVAVSPAVAAESAPPPANVDAPPLQAAEEALRAGIHKRCIELAQQALQTGQLDLDGVARAWWTRGRCHSIDGDADRAQRSYAVAVRVKPTILMPVDDAAFDRVKAEGTAADTALSLAAGAVVMTLAGGPLVAIEVRAHDDLALAKTCSLVDSDGVEVARAPLERGDPGDRANGVDVVHRFSGLPVEGLRALLLDKHGNRLREVDVVVDDAARGALMAAGGTPQQPLAPLASPVGWLSYVGAGTAVVGLLGAATSGITLAITTQADDAHVIDGELPWLLGLAGGVVAVVVGGALVVVDQLR